jgi:hypothetical protein
MAVLLWSLGLPSIRFAEAASVTSFSDTLSDSGPGNPANHTITFVTPSGMIAGETITLTFPTGQFGNISSLDFGDLDLAINGSDQTLNTSASGATWGVTTGANTISIISSSTAISGNATVTIEIGSNATFGVTGNTQITNPATTTFYSIDVEVGAGGDTGTTMVYIIEEVTVSATVETIFEFEIAGVAASTTIGSGPETSVVTTATSVPFGVLEPDTQVTGAQQLTVSTNAANGFVVTAQVDQQLTSSSNGADINSFTNGTNIALGGTPTTWTGPTPNINNPDSWGHWGLTSDDTTWAGSALVNPYDDAVNFVAASTTPVEVFRHDGPTNGTGTGVGTTQVAYSVEISPLQQAAEDYTATLTYVATPVF